MPLAEIERSNRKRFDRSITISAKVERKIFIFRVCRRGYIVTRAGVPVLDRTTPMAQSVWRMPQNVRFIVFVFFFRSSATGVRFRVICISEQFLRVRVSFYDCLDYDTVVTAAAIAQRRKYWPALIFYVRTDPFLAKIK